MRTTRDVYNSIEDISDEGIQALCNEIIIQSFRDIKKFLTYKKAHGVPDISDKHHRHYMFLEHNYYISKGFLESTFASYATNLDMEALYTQFMQQYN